MNKEELDLEFNKWESTLTYRQRKLANMKCDQEYGCTVPELYDKLNAQLASKDDMLIESLEVPEIDINLPRMIDWPLEEKIKTAKEIMAKEEDIIILIDYQRDNITEEELAELEDMYHKFESEISHDRRILSDNYSLSLWGKSVTDMYKLIKSRNESHDNKLMSTNDPLIRESVIDKTLSQTIDIYTESDALHREMMKIDAQINSESFYESSVLQESLKEIKENSIDYNKELPNVTPFLTFDEYCEYNEDTDATPYSYTFIENGKEYYDTIKKMQKNVLIEQQLKLGWNPAIPINSDTIKVAKSRQVKWFSEYYNGIQIIDISDMDTQLEDAVLEAETDNTLLKPEVLLKPVYIVLSFANTLFGNIITGFKHSEYSHAGISFDSSLDNIYTYNFQPDKKINGFTKESVKDYHNALNKKGDVKLMVNTIFVPEDAWKKMKETLSYYESNKDKSRYGFKNLLDFVTNKVKDSANSIYMVCSQFVDNLLKAANIDITNKSSNLVSPGDFEKPKEGSKMFVLFKGWKKDYDKKAIDKKVKALEKANTFQALNVMENAELIDHIFSCNLENFFNCDSNDPIVHESLVKIRALLTPTPAIVVNEFKLPIRFSDNGDLNIDLPSSLQAEYEESHKLLSMYDETNLNGIKHEVARMFYLNTIIERKLKRMKKSDKDFKSLMDLRARVLNDYTTYFKVIKAAEPNFDFLNYIKSTEYWNKTVVIDGTTLKYSGAFIKKAIDLLK